ncbi:MAG TPA: ABC transporter ATP-binding protein [Aestuariivirgaceae bacterium]|nr:ABC transporter ATP-binding protein [Aestuariivirgaceae bacterium]
MTEPIISIRGLTKRFASVMAVDDVTFDIPPNEFFALLGPSGCGKTTLLRMLAGLERPSAGEIVIDGQDMAFTPPNQRPVNMVFQSYAVFPHMTVEQNVGYGLKVVGTPKQEIASRVSEALAMVQLAELAKRRPDQLSGGQRQRVALARALVKRPKVLLLDEPLSALDAKLRDQMRMELTRLQQSVGITFIIVTHDQDEALSMADRIAVMDKGRISQIASPSELYEQPVSRFVADFIGKVNLIEADVVGRADGMLVCEAKGLGRLTVPHRGHASGRIALAIRPERLTLSPEQPPANGNVSVRGKVLDVAYYGDTSHVSLASQDGLELVVNVQNRQASARRGEDLWVSWAPEDTLVLAE